jgi:hypothetical protein
MKIKRIVFLLAYTFLALVQVKAQQSRIYGKVNTHDGMAGYATVSLRSLPDSSLVKGTYTNEHGAYELTDIDTGRYVLITSSIGYLLFQNEITIKGPTQLLRDITLLKDSAKYLNEVQVTARKQFITRSVDKTTVSIEGSVYEKGENGLRLFNVIPGVRVDPMGGILFRGAQAVTVYVDNRKIHLSGSQLLEYLRSIPSEAIRSYDLQAVPGAAYDAQNSGTIININLKSEYRYGLSGSIGTSYQRTRYNEFNENVNLNYHIGKLTLQAAYTRYDATQFQDSDELQHYLSSGLYNAQTNRWTSDVKYNSGKFGFDYKLNDNQTIGANYDFGVANFQSHNKAESVFNVADSTTNTDNYGSNRWSNQMANVFYRNRLDSLGSRLDIGYSYIGYYNSVGNTIINNYYDGYNHIRRPSDSLNIDNPLNVDIHVANIDVEKKLGGNVTLNAGAKYTWSRTDNAINYMSKLPGFDLKANQFLYKESITALYASMLKGWGKWSAKLGLRTENYRYTGNSKTTGESIGRNKWDFFPSLYLQRKITDDHVLTLSAARRISRPDYRQLNPFVDISNPYYIEKGNPFLRPYFSVSTELEYLFKNKYSFTGGFQRTVSAINTVYRNDGTVIIATDENVSNNSNVFLTINAPFRIASWWELSTSVTIRKTAIETPTRRSDKLSQDIWISSRFNLPHKYFMEITGLYGRNNFLGIYDLKPQGRIDINLKKPFMKEKLTALLNIGDPFDLYRIGWNVNETNFTRDVKRTIATRYINIGLTYNFSIGKKHPVRENIDAGGNDARNRL